jgi:predicted enzyme related to lactoylglutathione lyase
MLAFRPEITLAISVKDFEKSAQWYQDVLGCQPVYTMPEMGWGEFTTPVTGITIGLTTNQEDGTAGGDGGATITFGVLDIDAARAELEGKGVKFDGPTQEIPEMVKLATFRDLDGNALMFAQSLQQMG